MGGLVGVFHFESLSSPTQFNLNQALLGLGWSKSSEYAQFVDCNLDIKIKYSSILEYKHRLGELITEFCPEIAPITMTVNESNYKKIYQYISKSTMPTCWILKPALLNNGVGIKLFSAPKDLLQHFDSMQRYAGDHVLQAYIHPPHLLNGHKYSLRLFVILNSDKTVYLYKEGYFNICREPYAESDLTQHHTHLTNEHLDNGSSEPNNYQIPTSQCDFFKPVYSDIKVIMTRFFKAYKKITCDIDALGDKRSFIILGADFMLDSQLKTYLIEFNHGPCFPTTETHPLYQTLYQPFFKQLVSDFVVPIAFDKAIAPNSQSLFEKI